MHRRKLNNCLQLEDLKSEKWSITVAAPSHAAVLKHGCFGTKEASKELSALAMLEQVLTSYMESLSKIKVCTGRITGRKPILYH